MGSPATNQLAEVITCLSLDVQRGTETKEGCRMPQVTHPKPQRHLWVLTLLTPAGSSLQPSFPRMLSRPRFPKPPGKAASRLADKEENPTSTAAWRSWM